MFFILAKFLPLCLWYKLVCPKNTVFDKLIFKTLVLSLGQIDPECVCVCVSVCVSVCVRACVRACVRVISRKPWPVRVRFRVTQGLSLSNSPGVIETNGLSSSILRGQHKVKAVFRASLRQCSSCTPSARPGKLY